MNGAALLLEEYRGELLDLTHYGYITVVDEKGKVIYSAGDSNAMVFYRSASKPIQGIHAFHRILHLHYRKGIRYFCRLPYGRKIPR